MIGIYINNKEHHVTAIFDGLKTVETRTRRAAAALVAAGVVPGAVVAIISRSYVVGLVKVLALIDYQSEQEFKADFERHRVAPGSCYGFDPSRGKTGFVLGDPVRVPPYPVPKQKRPTSFIALNGH